MEAGKAGQVASNGVEEVQGIFQSDAAMQAAMGQLKLSGFDEAALSLPTTLPLASQATPDQGASAPIMDDDMRQVRTMGASMAGTVGAFAAAGATLMTGGAAGVAIAAAAAVGAGSLLAGEAIGTTAKHAVEEGRADAAAEGRLVLAVNITDPAKRDQAKQIMFAAGATEVRDVVRDGGDIATLDSTGWTG